MQIADVEKISKQNSYLNIKLLCIAGDLVNFDTYFR